MFGVSHSGGLTNLLARWGDELPLDAAFAEISVEENPALHPDSLLHGLDELAAHLHIPVESSPFEATARLNHHLFTELGFDSTGWDDRDGYLLNDLLESRLGVPVSLCILTMEVSRRAGFPLTAIGFPTHCLVAPLYSSPTFYIDPARAGEVFNEDDLRERLHLSLGLMSHPSMWVDAIAPLTNRELIARLCETMKAMQLRTGDLDAALRSSERILQLVPSRLEELTDQGVLHVNLGRPEQGAEALERYLAQRPYAPNAKEIVRQIGLLRGSRA